MGDSNSPEEKVSDISVTWLPQEADLQHARNEQA